MIERRFKIRGLRNHASLGYVLVLGLLLFIYSVTASAAESDDAFSLVDLTADAVIGFNYIPETTATIEIYDGLLQAGTAIARTDADGYFEIELGGLGIDIKNGNRVAVTTGGQSAGFTTNLNAGADFNTGVVSGKTERGSLVLVHVWTPGSPSGTDTTTTADGSGNYAISASFGLNDRIWVSSLHSSGNLTQLELIFGTSSRALRQENVYTGGTTETAGDIEIKEIKPTSLASTTTANEVTLEILTPEVSFTQAPKALPETLQLLSPNASLSANNKKATWYVSQSTTTTAGSIILRDIKYDVGTSTASGPVELRLGGNSGVTAETISNAKVLPSSTQTSFKLDVTVVDTDTGQSLGGARVRVLKGDNLFMSQITPPSGGGTFSLPADTYDVYITRIGYQAVRSTIQLTENTSTVVRLTRSDIGVVVPEGFGRVAYERIEPLIQDLGYRVSLITQDDITDAQMLKDNLKTLFINSSDVSYEGTHATAVREFVRAGGSLYTSDASFALMNAAFSGKLTFKANPWITRAQQINAGVKDGGLADYLGLTSPANLTLNFKIQMLPWVLIDNTAPGVDVYLSANVRTGPNPGDVLNNKPLVASFNEGSGRVLYTSYYASSENGVLDDNGGKLLRYMVLSTLAGKDINSLKTKLAADGYTLDKMNVGLLNSGETSTACGITVPTGKDVIARLAWRDSSQGGKNASYRLSVLQSDATLREETANQSPVTVVSADAPAGSWAYRVKALDAGDGYPYVVATGTRAATPPPVDPGPNPSGGGSSGGGGGGGNDTVQTVLPKPTGLKAEAGNGKITLTWNTASAQSSAPQIAGYNIYRGTKPTGLVTRINSTPLMTTSYSDTTVEPNITYYFWVTTVGSDGKESARSDYASVSLTAVLPDLTFSDTQAAAWYMTYVKKLVTAGIIDGYSDGSFRPNANITRAEFCKIVLAALGETPLGGAALSFKDTGGHWAQGHIEKAKSLGFIDGYKDGSFRPNAGITRAEICKMVAYAKQYRLGEHLNAFPDCSGHWAEIYIATAQENGVVSGFPDGTFRPSAKATRAEASKMISVMMGK
ncbi:MAG: S-layer homology domain-containing protein [Candidatus Aquicultor sp.]|nr:S-layer homology domain-containing protein [Candidatus Aquicultor sp.]